MHGLQSALRTGNVLRGQYSVFDVLGLGAFGAVYLVKDEQNSQRKFVLKEVMHTNQEKQCAFSFDAAALKRLYHPALPDIYQLFSGDENDRFYILTDYVEGPSLEQMRQLMPGKRFSLHTALTLMSPIMDAISYLHRQHPHLVHGDIKPCNIIASLAGTATRTKLVDFGGVHNVYTDASAQQGKLNYRAPEQFGRSASRRTDVYGLGATFYTILTGRVPVAAPERLAHISQGKADPLLPVNQVKPFAHLIVADAISRAMSLSRNDRFTSVEHFRESLWQVMHAGEMEPWTAVFPLVVPVEEHTRPVTGPDSSNLETDTPALIAYALMQQEVTFAGVSSGSLLSPTLPEQGKTPELVPSRAMPVVVRRKKRRVFASDTTHGTHSSRRRRRRARSLFLVALLFLLSSLIGSSLVFAGYQIYHAKYQSEVTLAQTGTQHLQAALYLMEAWSKNPLAASSVTNAQQEFASASAVFTQLNTDLHASPGIASLIPGYTARLNAAFRVIPIALEISQGGIAGCDALNVILSRFHEPFDAGSGITLADLTEVKRDFHQVEVDIKQATAQVNTLQSGDLQFDARIGKAVALFHQYLPTVQAFLHQTDQLLPILPALIGISTPAYYLVEMLDSTQLRPGGGFIKDYGFATLIGGRLSAAHISDANLLDNQFANTGQTIPYPQAYKWFGLDANSWSLRDSNLDADFPTAAGYAEQNYNLEGGRAPLQGVIAITTTLMQRALAITGTVSIPQLHESVTSQNLVDRIHYYQVAPASHGASILTPGGTARGSRYFTELLAQNFLTRIHQVRAAVVPKLFQMLVSSLRSKDLQIYFNASPAESLLGLSQADAAIHATTGDSFFVVDANISADTANQFINSALDDQVTIDDRGNATHHATIRYAWLKQGKVFGTPHYLDYVRVYVPRGSTLQAQQGWQPGGTSEAFHHQVWAGSFTLSQGQTNTITLTWIDMGAAKKDVSGWHYQYLVQRQAGVSWMLNVAVTLPACAVKSHASGGYITQKGRTTMLSQPLTGDTNLSIGYSC
jgi:serine/threonine protein kinase